MEVIVTSDKTVLSIKGLLPVPVEILRNESDLLQFRNIFFEFVLNLRRFGFEIT
jgi:hypothetical protein